jgi:hypothetical protein
MEDKKAILDQLENEKGSVSDFLSRINKLVGQKSDLEGQLSVSEK